MSWSEESVIQLIRESLQSCLAQGAHDLLDDGAWLPKVFPSRTRVISCDAFQEGNDFLLKLSPVETAGYRAIVQNLSDLAAMGASPVGFVWSLEVPDAWLKKRGALLKGFCEGAARACKEYKLSFYGGDLSFSADRFGCTITILGDVKGKPLSRRGAKPGDNIYVSHSLGMSAFGLDVLFNLKTKLSKIEKTAASAHLSPRAEIDLGKKLVAKATACMDISDGLARDLHRLCKASGVGAELDNVEAVFHPDLPQAKAREYAIYGGEEFALLFTAHDSFKAPKSCVRIGRVTRELGVFETDGRTRKSLASQGYDHFASRT